MFKVIEDYETARVLSEAGLLWCALKGQSPYPDSLGYWTDARWFYLMREQGTEYYLLLEE